MDPNHLEINTIRTTLLISINKELSSLKKNCTTKIQSRTLNEFEDLFYSCYDNFIQLKEESFIPQNYTREVIQEKKLISKFHLQSPDNLEIKFSKKSILESINALYNLGCRPSHIIHNRLVKNHQHFGV